MKIAPLRLAGRGRLPLPMLVPVLMIVAAPAAWADAGYLGVNVQSVDEAMAAALNLEAGDAVMVREVMEDSPAEAAGLQKGDVILTIDGREARDPASFTRRVRRIDPGEKATLEVVRQGKSMNIEVSMGESEDNGFYSRRGQHVEFFDVPSPDDSPITVVAPRALASWHGSGAQLGVNVHGLDENLGRYFGAKEGVLVLGVMEDTAAEDAGFQEGDVILSVAGDKVGTTMDLHELIADYEPGDEVAVQFLRDKKEQTVQVELGESNDFAFVRDLRNDGKRRHNVRFDRAPSALRIHDSHRDVLEAELEQMRERLEKLEAELDRAGGN